MKYAFGVLIMAALVLCSDQANAQRRHPPRDQGGPRPERLEKFKKMRLIEVLKLSEDDAVRFFAKQSTHEDTQRELMKSRNEALDKIEDADRGKADNKSIQNLIDEIESLDQKMFAERQRFHEDIRKLLSAEQFGKFLVFERNFGRQVKDALQEMRGERGRY